MEAPHTLSFLASCPKRAAAVIHRRTSDPRSDDRYVLASLTIFGAVLRRIRTQSCKAAKLDRQQRGLCKKELFISPRVASLRSASSSSPLASSLPHSFAIFFHITFIKHL